MEKKLRELLKELDHEDLYKLKRDLDETQGLFLKELVNQNISDIEEKEKKTCAGCGSSINSYLIDDFTLSFGPRDFKKRAHFCGLDCMEFFISEMRAKSQQKLARHLH